MDVVKRMDTANSNLKVSIKQFMETTDIKTV